MSVALDRLEGVRRRTRSFARAYPFESHFLDLDGASLHFVDEGPRGAEPLVFLHGNPTWSFLWREPIKAFRADHRCVAPDHIGCGFSDKPQDYPYRLERHVENLERLVDRLQLERLTLVVHDWGGAIGFSFAVRHPERVARLIVMNTAAFPGPCPLRIRICRTPFFGPMAVRGLNAFARGAVLMASERGLDRETRRGFLEPYRTWSERVATLRFVQDIPLAPSHPSWSRLQEIDRGLVRLGDKPMCVIWGERDWCFTPHFRREWQRRFPRARVHVVESAGHWVMEDARDDVIRWMREFLASPPSDP